MLEIFFEFLTIFSGLFLLKVLCDYKNAVKQKRTVISMLASNVLCVLFFAFCQIFSKNVWLLNLSKALLVFNSAFCFCVFGFSIVTLLAFGKPNKEEL